MKFTEILEDVKLDTQEYLNETVTKKGKRYYAVKNGKKKDCLPGTKEAGYASLENAVKAMMDQTNSDFKALDFEKKKKRVDNYVKKWKKDNGVKEPKTKKQYGFEQIIFTTDEE